MVAEVREGQEPGFLYLDVTYTGKKNYPGGDQLLVELQRLDDDERVPGGKVLLFRFERGILTYEDALRVYGHALLLFGPRFERVAIWDSTRADYFVLTRFGFGGVFRDSALQAYSA